VLLLSHPQNRAFAGAGLTSPAPQSFFLFMIGRIKLFSRTKNFGFIANEGGEWFFHASAVRSDLADLRSGDHVEFLLDDDPRGRGGLVAVDVERISAL
jgi:cold shock CspA family protein